MKLQWNKVLGWGILLVILSWFAYGVLSPLGTKVSEKTISDVADDVKTGQIAQVTLEGNRMNVITKAGEKYYAIKEPSVSLQELGIDLTTVPTKVKDAQTSSLIMDIVSSVVPFLLIVVFLWWILKQAQGANNQAMMFGRSRAKMVVGEGRKKITFKDVAGSDEVKQELVEVVEFLKYPGKFRNLGAEIPKGVLLVGPPGTGKTLLARAVAGEAGVPFFSISGSEFVEMFVGVGASRVRDLFNKAKRSAPAIIFIDEIDAVGRQRGTGLGGSHDEREQTLNQILVEMDGFDNETNVIVVAATNRPDVLDPALLRPGRFDRRVAINLPDINERELILQVHCKVKPLANDVDLRRVAGQTPGFSGADLHNLTNEAAILAARTNKTKISSKDFELALEKVLLGPERTTSVMNDEEKKITAYHETGHAIVGQILEHGDPIQKVSIISRGQALGYTWSMPTQDRRLFSKEKFMHDIAVMLGGRVAEEMVFGKEKITTGASSDINRATKLARRMVTRFGMSEKVGPLSLGADEEMVFMGRDFHESKNYSEHTATMIDEEVSKIIDEAQKLAVKALSDNKDKLKAITAKLVEQETLSKEEFESFFGADLPKTE